jgi:hypothetical protein
MNTPPTRKANKDKSSPHYNAWLAQLRILTDYHGAITDLSTHVAAKYCKEMKNVRPTISKILKGQRTASVEYLLIIQEWMNTKTTRTGKN